MNIEQNKITEKVYRGIDLLSSSSLRDYAEDLKKFYKRYVTKEEKYDEDEYVKSFKVGSVGHCLLLEAQELENKYHLSTVSAVPTANMLKFVEALFKHTKANTDEEGQLTVDFAELCALAYPESEYKIKLEAVINKFAGGPQEYYQELRTAYSINLEVVTTDDLNIANRIVEIAKNDEFVGALLRGDEEDGVEYFHETKAVEFQVFGRQMKAMLDKIRVDHKAKEIEYFDIKIVYDNQNFYYNYYLKRRADIQGAIYYEALLSRAIDLGFDYSDYNINFPTFIAIDSGCFYAPLQYPMTKEDIDNACNGFETENGRYYPGVQEILKGIEFGESTGIWNRKREDYINRGIKQLK